MHESWQSFELHRTKPIKWLGANEWKILPTWEVMWNIKTDNPIDAFINLSRLDVQGDR